MGLPSSRPSPAGARGGWGKSMQTLQKGSKGVNFLFPSSKFFLQFFFLNSTVKNYKGFSGLPVVFWGIMSRTCSVDCFTDPRNTFFWVLQEFPEYPKRFL